MFDHRMLSRIAFSFVFTSLFTQFCSAGEIQRMINNAKPGGTVFIEDGVYKECLVIDKDIKLIGNSRAGVILSPLPSAAKDAIYIQENRNVSIVGITIEVSKPGDTPPKINGIMGFKSKISVSNCLIKGSGYNGIFLIDCDSVITNCDILSNNKSGFQAKFGKVKITGSTISKNKTGGIYCWADKETTGIKHPSLTYEISDCLVSQNNNGLYFNGNCSGNVINNRIINNEKSGTFHHKCTGKNDVIANVVSQGHYGISLESLKNTDKQNSVVEKNICSNLKIGIYLNGEGTVADVSANQCNNNDEIGIKIKNGVSVKLLNNVCNDNGTQGIYLLRAAKGTLLENNVCHRNKKNGIYIGAGYVTARKNDCKGNSYNGISVDCGVVNIEKNECAVNKGSGIYLARYIDGSVTGNTSTNNRFYGIVRVNHSVIAELQDNDLTGNSKGTMWEEQNQFKEIWRLLKARKFAELDSMASVMRKEQSKNPSGQFLIRSFYNTLGTGWENISPEHPDQVVSLLNEWIKERPKSITPYVILSDLYITIGWGHRGNGWAYEVKDDDWEKFHEILGKAVEVVRNGEKLEEKDAHLYCRLIKIGMATSDSKMEKEGLEKGVAINKYYPPLYFAKANALQPRWGGKPGELEAFALDVFKQTKDKYDAILYARIALSTHTWTYPKFEQFNFSYDLIKQGHEDILKRYPDSKHYMNSYCMFACLNNDLEKAKELFKKIGTDYSYAIWKDQENLKGHYDWVFSKNIP